MFHCDNLGIILPVLILVCVRLVKSTMYLPLFSEQVLLLFTYANSSSALTSGEYGLQLPSSRLYPNITPERAIF